MPLEIKSTLFQMQQAAEGILLFCKGRAFADYTGDLMFRLAVERQFEIGGEALNRLRSGHPEIAERISEHRKVIAFRNALIRGYDVIDHATTWRIITDKLPTLLDESRAC